MTDQNKSIDIRGEMCPYTFVKSKLALEDMNVGEVLEILIDSEESVENVPKTLANEGHTVLSVTKEENHWKILVRKEVVFGV